ncbi:MAG: DivIVA domain-containing protein [Gemmatimonadales bacterium]|nr:DivIVA domain-containing protein [Gemmatimonadales bacterium]
MRITPLDVRKQEFRRSVRGFDCDEVRAFLATLADEYEIVLVDNKQIREHVMHLDGKITEYQTMERTLRDTLMTAEKLMQETRENANKEGDLILQDAKLQAKQIMQECRLRTEGFRRELEGLRKEKENYLGRFKSLAESQIQFIESHRADFKDLDDRLTGIVDSVEEVTVSKEPEVEKEAAVETIVEAMIQPEQQEQPENPPTIDSGNSANSPKVDVWRSYNPATSRNESETAPEAGIPAQAPAQDHTPEQGPKPENDVQHRDWLQDGENTPDNPLQWHNQNQESEGEKVNSEHQESKQDSNQEPNQEQNRDEITTETLNI